MEKSRGAILFWHTLLINSTLLVCVILSFFIPPVQFFITVALLALFTSMQKKSQALSSLESLVLTSNTSFAFHLLFSTSIAVRFLERKVVHALHKNHTVRHLYWFQI